MIIMDFVLGLPRGKRGNDAIWVIVDRLTKSAFFLPVKMTDPVDKLAKMYVNEVVRLHGVPISVVSDRDLRFTSRLWPSIQRALETNLSISTTFHPQIDGQSVRDSNLRGFTKGMCFGIWWKLRGALVTSRIHV
jgi:hypothetical protein